jgi:hypothetical protein
MNFDNYPEASTSLTSTCSRVGLHGVTPYRSTTPAHQAEEFGSGCSPIIHHTL